MKNLHDDISFAGEKPSPGKKALVMVHGRGGSAEDILSLGEHLKVKDFALAAPQAEGNTWYPFSFMAPLAYNQFKLDIALEILKNTLDILIENGIEKKDIYFLGFSQGACLVSEFVARNATRYGGIIILTGGLIGEKLNISTYKGDFNGTDIFMGTADPDPHVPVSRVEESALILTEMGGNVIKRIYPGMPHTIGLEEIREVNDIFFS